MPPPSPSLTLSPPVISNPPSWVTHEPGRPKLTTPPTTPPWAVLKSNNGSGSSKFPTTPPPVRKHSTGIQKSDCALIKSKSHESELTNRIGKLIFQFNYFVKGFCWCRTIFYFPNKGALYENDVITISLLNGK